MEEIMLHAKCNFKMEKVDNEICHLSWDASDTVNQNCERYDGMVNLMYSEYLKSKIYEEHKRLYVNLRPKPDDVVLGTGCLAIFYKDIDEMENKIKKLISKFICSTDSLSKLTAPIFLDDKPGLPISTIGVLNEVIYNNDEGIKYLDYFYDVTLSLCNNNEALVSYDLSKLTKLDKRGTAIGIRFSNIYKAYRENREIVFNPEDSDEEFYINIEDISPFVLGLDNVIKDEIKMEYR